MVRIGICDDVERDRRQVAGLVKKWAGGKGIETALAEYGSGEEFLQERNVDVLLLDIEMEGTDGILVKDRLQKEQAETRIIFITNHRELVEEAFGKQVFGFVTKPVSYEKLEKKLEAVLEDIDEENRVMITGAVEERCVRAEHIVYIKANGKYSDVRLENQEELFSGKNIGTWAKELESMGFFLSHRSYLVNLYHVRRIEDEIVLLNGERVPLSRRAKSGLKTAYREYLRRKAK